MPLGSDGEIISPQKHFEAARQSVKETFGMVGLDNYSLMEAVTPRFIDIVESDSQEKEQAQVQRYSLSKIRYENGGLYYSLAAPLGSPLPHLEIYQESGGGNRSVTMYKRPDFGTISSDYDRGMIDHFSSSLGGKATYLESIANAYNYLNAHGVSLENCEIPLMDEEAYSRFPQINTLKARRKEALIKAEERRSRIPIPDTFTVDEPESVETNEEGESTFKRKVSDIVNALYPSGEIGAFGNYVLLAAEAYDNPTEVDGLANWMWGDQAEFAVASLDISSFMRNMLNQARNNPGILGANERLFIVSSPPMWEPTPDDEYITLVTHTADGKNHTGKMHVFKLNLPGGGTRAASAGAPSYIGRFPREWVDVDLQKEIDASDFSINSAREVAHKTIMMHENIGGQTFDRPLNLDIVGEPKTEIIRDPIEEAAEAAMQRQLHEEMIRHLASPQSVTVEYYAELGKSDPSIEREGAAWERFIVLNSADEEYGIAIHLLKNDPDWQSKDRLRLKPRGDKDQLRLVFLQKNANILGSVVFSPRFEALIETYPDNHAGIMIQEYGQPVAKPDRGRIESWENGSIFVQDPRIHIGTTDHDQYTPPRNMTKDELPWILNILKNAKFDPELMQKLVRNMTSGRHQGSRVTDSDPFMDLLDMNKDY